MVKVLIKGKSVEKPKLAWMTPNFCLKPWYWIYYEWNTGFRILGLEVNFD